MSRNLIDSAYIGEMVVPSDFYFVQLLVRGMIESGCIQIVSDEKVMSLRISVAMATFNGERYLEDQLDSILAQTAVPHELVVCDDASTDQTVAIIESATHKASFPIRVFRNPVNLGSTKNFERAIRLCEGDIVVLADQDDIWSADKLGMIGAEFAANPACVGVFSDALLVDENARELNRTLWRSVGLSGQVRKKLAHGGVPAFRALLKKNYITGATFAFRADLRGSILPIPECWVHDAWIGLLLAAIGPIRSLPDELVRYRQHATNQIGIRQQSVAVRAAEHRAIDMARNCLVPLIDRLAVEADERSDCMLRYTRAKESHLRRRVATSNSMLPLVWDFACGRYLRYSNGLLSFAKDAARRLSQ